MWRGPRRPASPIEGLWSASSELGRCVAAIEVSANAIGENNRNTVHETEERANKNQQGATTNSSRRKRCKGQPPRVMEKVMRRIPPDSLSVLVSWLARSAVLRSEKHDQLDPRGAVPIHSASLELGKWSRIWPAKEAYVAQVVLAAVAKVSVRRS
jgi:hypothetical protein